MYEKFENIYTQHYHCFASEDEEYLMIKTYSWILFILTIVSKHNLFGKSSNYLKIKIYNFYLITYKKWILHELIYWV